MNFDFSPEQQQFRDQLRRYLRDADGLAEGRSLMESGAERHSRAIWRGLADLGVQATAVPEAYSGLGLGALELCVAAEEIGRAMAPVPFLSSVGVCSEAIRLFGTPEQKARWLPGLADGSIIGTWGAVRDASTAEESDRLEAGRLYGTKVPVLDGMAADVMLVVSTTVGGAPILALCDLADAAVKRKAVPTIDPTRPAARVTFHGAPAEPLLDHGAAAWEQLCNRAAVLLAFEQLGSAEAAMAMAIGYARDRTAFGRTIASMQAVKHRLADMYIKIELARAHCYYGAWAISTNANQSPLAAAGARCSAIEALDYAAQENIHVHGGIGVTWESNCHLFYRRARLNGLILGARQEWQDRLVAALQEPGMLPS
ncbi:acyl-CoA dehydrogenase [Rhizobiales bacterium GAS191]|nr:acyl-CoA dehydrogenase [Rhizobiales bacterium GAS191]